MPRAFPCERRYGRNCKQRADRIVCVYYGTVQCVHRGDTVTVVSASVLVERIQSRAIESADNATADRATSAYSASTVSSRQMLFPVDAVSRWEPVCENLMVAGVVLGFCNLVQCMANVSEPKFLGMCYHFGYRTFREPEMDKYLQRIYCVSSLSK